MKQKLLKLLRYKAFQPFWVKLHHISLVGMNHWGGANLYNSGEVHALNYMVEKLKDKSSIMVFDVGANYGQYALLANSLIKNKLTINSFEPSKYTCDILIKETQDHDHIIIHNMGLGDKKCKLKLYSSGKGSPVASVYNLSNRTNQFKEDYSEEIELTTLDSFCNDNNISTIDILKIDIEGHELFALKGASEKLKNSKINFIQFEFGECNIDSKTYFKDFYDILSSNFNLYRIVSNGLYKLGDYDESFEVFHTANFLAERKTLLKTI